MRKKILKSQLKQIKKLFEQKRKELISSIEHSKQDEVDVAGDEVDFVQGSVLSEVASKLSKRDMDQLEKIEEALRKIDNGTFGFCEECDELINEKRLLALPGCTICVNCAEEQELESKQYYHK